MLDSEKILFEKGCFLPCWAEDIPKEEPVISKVHTLRNKDLQTLFAELDEIKKHIENIRERQWILAKQIHFYNNNLVKE